MPQIGEKVVYPELSYLICGLCFVTQNQLGRFRSERQYADYLESLLREKGIVYQREMALAPSFINERRNRNKPDFLIEGKIVLDVKAKRLITKDDYYQMKRYLVSGRKRLGLIVNFRPRYVVIKRVLNPHA